MQFKGDLVGGKRKTILNLGVGKQVGSLDIKRASSSSSSSSSYLLLFRYQITAAWL